MRNACYRRLINGEAMCIMDMHDDRRAFLKMFSANLRVQRKRRGFTQERLSELSGISYKYFQELESGKKCPSALMLIRLSEALEVKIDELIDPDGGNPK